MPLSGILGQLGAAPSGAPAPAPSGAGLSGMLGSLAQTRTAAASADTPDAPAQKRPPAPQSSPLPAPDFGVSESTPQIGGKPLTFGDVLGGLKAIPGLAWDAVSAIPKALVNSELHPSADEQSVEQKAMSHPTDTFGKIAQALPNAGTAAAFRFFQPMFQPYADDLSQSLVAPEFTDKVAKGEIKYSDFEQAFPVLQKSNAQVVADSVIAGLSAYMPGFFGESVSRAATIGGIDALKQGATSGVMAGGLFASAQVVSSGTDDPGEIGKIFAENLVGGALLGGLVHSTIPLSKEAFTAATKDIQKTYGIPESVYISPEKVRDVFQTGTLASERENDLLRSLGLTGEQWRQAIKEGVAIEIPAQNVTTITDKPYWGQIKDAFGLQPTKTTVRAEPVPQMSERIMNPSRQLPSPEDIKARIAAGRTPEEVTHELAQDVPFTEAQKAVEEAQNTPEPPQEPAKPETENAVEQTAPVSELDKTPGMIQQELGVAQSSHEDEQAALQKQLADLQEQVKQAPAQSAEKKALKVEIANVKAKLETGLSTHQDTIAGKGGAFADAVGSHIQEKHGLPPEQAAMLAGKVAEHVANPTEETHAMPVREIAARVVAEHKTAQLYSEGETVVMKGAGSSFPDGEYKITGRMRTPSDTKYELTDKSRKPVWTNQNMLDAHGSRKTQAQKVKEAVAKKGSAKAGEVAKEIGILEPNVRRILGVGAKQGEFERVGEGVYKVKTPDGKDVAFVIPGDALKELPRLAKEGFKADMVFLDIPYKTKALTGGNRGIKDYEFISPAEFNHVLRAVNQIVQGDHSSVFYMFSQAKSGQKEMDVYTSLFETNGFKPVARGEWTKLFNDGSRATNPRGEIQAPEGIIMFNKSGEMPEGKEAPSLAFKLVRPRGYQTEKPAELLKALIEMSTKEGETVLDPFAGSGVAIEEAVKSGRKAVGIEKKKGQAAKAAARAQAAISRELPATREEAAATYWKDVIAPAIKAKKAVVIGADDLKDYFNHDYDLTRHPIYSQAANALFERAIKTVKNPLVKFTIGGTGSGKSDFVVAHQAQDFDGVIYDSTGWKYEDGIKNQIEYAEDNGKHVELYGVIPDITKARAYTLMRELRGEHPVTETAFVRTHSGAIETMQKAIADNIPTYVLDARGVVLDKEDFSKNPEFELNPVAKLADLGYSENHVKNAIAGITKENAHETLGLPAEGAAAKRGGKEGTENLPAKNGTGEGLKPLRTAGDTKLTVPRASTALGGTRTFEGDTPDGTHFTTNTFVAQFGEKPADVVIRESTLEKAYPTAGESIQKIIEGLKKSEPLAAPKEFSQNAAGTILYLPLPGGSEVMMNSLYYNYFVNTFKGAELRGTGATAPVGVYKDGELTGLIMPINPDRTLARNDIAPKAKAGGRDFSSIPEDLKPAHETPEQDNSLLPEKPPREPKPEAEKESGMVLKQELDPRELYNAERAIEQNHPRGFVGTVFKETATLFNPRGQVQTPALDVIMRNKGEFERMLFRTERAMREVKNMWDAHTQEVGLDFMDKVETGRIDELPPEFHAIAEMYRQRLDNAYQAISEFKDVPFLENYFPHLWKDPKSVAESNLWAKANARRPLQGSKSFMKHRIFATIQDGIKAGYELATHNPEELMQLHEQNIQKFIMANRIMQDLKERGFTKFVPVGSKGKPPEGFARLNDAISKVYLNPHIPILEAYDEHVYNALASVIEGLGLEHDRKYDIGARGALGFTRNGTDKITTKFGSPLSVIAHELGHQLDYKYGLKELFKTDPNRTYGNETDYAQKELRALADLRYEGHDVTDSYKQYIRSAPEKIAVMLEAYVHAPEKFKEVAPRTYEKFTEFLRSHKETAPLLDVKPGLVYGVREDSIYAGGLIIGGEHWVQKDVARLLNNFLSSDHLMDTAIGRGIMNMKNTMNALELGFSAFHLTMETLDTMITKFGIGLTKVVHGDFTGFKDMAISPSAPVTYFLAGQKFYNGDPELMKIEKDLFTGGASLRQKQYYKNTVFDRFMTTNREIVAMVKNASYDATKSIPGQVLKPESKLKKAPAIVKAVAQNTLRIPMAVVEATMRPLFTYYIPRLKVGAFRDLFAAELERNSQRIQDGEMTRESIARDVWNNVENRMGELNYDNLFWDRNLKTGLMLTTRAVGWNLGTVREIGGAMFQDIPREAGKAAQGKGFNFTSKMGYTFSLFFFVATIGAIYQYLHTGKKPESVKDLYYPRNGATTAAGEPYRVEFPTYLKDIYQSGVPQLLTGNPFGAFDSFTSMLKNKSAPELSALLDIMNNRDFYGNEIRNPHDNTPTQAKQVTLYALSTLTPFTLQQQQNLAAGKSNAEQQAEAFLGIIRAPKAVIQSDYNAQLEAIFQDQQGLHAPETPEQQAAYERKQAVVDQIRKGDYSGIQALVNDGTIKPSGLRSFIQNAVLTTPQKQYRYLSPENKAKARNIK